MKVLWIVNTIFPYPSKMLGKDGNVFGGWMIGLKESLIKTSEISLAIATTYDGRDLKKYDDGNTIYYLIPSKNRIKYEKEIEKYWQYIANEYKPDLVHLHGTEYAHGLAFLRSCPNIKSVVSIQGLVYLYGQVYLSNIESKDIIKNITLRDIVRHDNMFQAKREYLRRGAYEKEILNRANLIIGRTSWDYAATLELNNSVKYRFCNESLRNEFYKYHWDYEKIEKNTIFISQASYPIKAFHEMVKALPIIKSKYPDVKVYVAGVNILKAASLKERLKLTGYSKYIAKLIKKYNLEDNIVFTGLLDAKEMVKRMLKCHVFVQASVIENSPNSLGEAMLLGMPIVASNVGGTSDMLVDKQEGLLYPYGEKNMLAKYVLDIFDNSIDAISLGIKANIHATKTHDCEKNVKDMIKIYKEVINK